MSFIIGDCGDIGMSMSSGDGALNISSSRSNMGPETIFLGLTFIYLDILKSIIFTVMSSDIKIFVAVMSLWQILDS